MKSYKYCSCNQTKYNSIEDIPLDCRATYDMISRGGVCGIFQVEGPMGKKWAKGVAPGNLEELADLLALIRPGCINSGMTQNYIDVKWGKKPAEYLHPLLEPILSKTNASCVYQEQVMQICASLANMSLEESDILRVGIGKKIPEIVESVKPKFINGCVKNNIEREVAKKIFSWFEECAEYLFNKSHAIAYALLSYRTAWLKFHDPVNFYWSMLHYSKNDSDKFEELSRVINDCRIHDIEVRLPSVDEGNEDFTRRKDSLLFGLSYIKHIGASKIKRIKKIKGTKTLCGLILKLSKLDIGSSSALIQCGACDEVVQNVPRVVKLNLVKLIHSLTKKEKESLYNLNTTSIKTLLRFLKDFSTNEEDKDKLNEIKNKYGSLPTIKRRRVLSERVSRTISNLHKKDSYRDKISFEKYYLGISLSGSEAAMYTDPSNKSSKCINIHKASVGKTFSVISVLENISETKTKRGQNPGQKMCFLKISDETCILDGCVIFPPLYKKTSDILIQGAVRRLRLKKQKDGYVVNNIEILEN